MRDFGKSRGTLVGLTLLAIVGVSACSATQAPSGGPGTGQTTTPAVTVTSSPSANATPTEVQNLAISSAARSELTAEYTTTYAADLKVPISDLGAPAALPGSVYYAYDPATDTYWALGTFEPTAPDSNPAWFQDGTEIGMFQKVGAAAWQVHIAFNPVLCDELRFFPQAVLLTWALPTAPTAGLTC